MVNFETWLFSHLPQYFKDFDTYIEKGPGILERFVSTLGKDLDTTMIPKLTNFWDIHDVITTEDIYITYIAWVLGNPPRTFYDEASYRKLLKYVLDINKVKGTSLSYELLFGIMGIEVEITEHPLTPLLYDSGLNYDSDEHYDLNCPPCSGYDLTLIDPNGVMEGWEENPLLEAMLNALIKYVEPINARMIEFNYVEPTYPLILNVSIPSDGYTLYLPLQSGYQYDCIVNWGDGTEPLQVTSFNSINTQHTYNSAGSYNISIMGMCQAFNTLFGTSYNTMRQCLRGVIRWGNTSDLRSLCLGYSNIESFPYGPITGAPNLETLTQLFRNCSNLTGEIPGDLFSLLPKLYYVGDLFRDCPGLTGLIPVNLFKDNPLLTHVFSAFSHCSGLTGSIPADLFRHNPILSHASNVFQYCSGLTGSIPADLFRHNPYLSYVDGIFQYCTGLTGSIPEDLFKDNPIINSFTRVFSHCSGLTGSIPADLFRYNTLAKTFMETFNYCSGLTGSIPEDLFRYNTGVTGQFSFRSTFSTCSGLTGSIPVGLFKYNILATDFDYTFLQCSGLTGSIPEDLFKYNTIAIEFIGTFTNCRSLIGTIPENLFRYNPEVVSFNSTFYACQSLTGPLPANLFRYNPLVESFSNTFTTCFNLNGSIPQDLFRYNTLCKSFASTFGSCSALTGSIPQDLFRYNTLVGATGFHTVFNGCSGLTGAIPQDLFRYNTLVSADGFRQAFAYCSGLTGAIPQDLFRYNTLVSGNAFYQTFQYCSNLEEAPDGLFHYNTLVTSFYWTFHTCLKLKLNPYIFYPNGEEATFFAGRSMNFTGCFLRGTFMGVQGTAPELWNCTFGSVISATCFGGAGNSPTSLSNYADIPINWK